ncbi:hypothetical protein SAMN05192558_101133 [Actinokineospora alba]|uniref:Uncharacterized protein n=1 Tax=Actinokineospora alba TaxID=504798 RepID=A0A1H0EWV6_9PSEU|nr:hypothetical protein [Actinokineospora alba]TDP69254.1 hypothetical protein C8E96_4830 [Actinokineospora alba]SDI20902.1 hypothetical protein SAMN05421871_103736 [Actinokineospora alba]SDN86835.1 hypothetical protein SAMN05192558_101133 [Actinokineospora alba]
MEDDARAKSARVLMAIAGGVLAALLAVAALSPAEKVDTWGPIVAVTVGSLAAAGLLFLGSRVSGAADIGGAHRQLVRFVPFACAGVVLAVGALAWPTTAAARVTEPTEFHIHFDGDQRSLRQAGVPIDCAGDELTAVAVDGTLLEPVVTGEKDGCRLRLQLIPAGIAMIKPVVKAP